MVATGRTTAPEEGGRSRGVLRTLAISLGIFALIVVGVHAGADHIDDGVFILLNWIDGVADTALDAGVRWVYGLLEKSPDAIEEASFAAQELIDLDLKLASARTLALALELFVDLVLALPLIAPHRVRLADLPELAKRTFSDPTLLRFAAPIAVAAAGLAGTLAVAREIQVAGYQAAHHAVRSGLATSIASRTIGVTALLTSALLLLLPAIARASLRADRIASSDRVELVKPVRRRLRGAVTLLIALPVALVAVVEAPPLIGTIRALVWP